MRSLKTVKGKEYLYLQEKGTQNEGAVHGWIRPWRFHRREQPGPTAREGSAVSCTKLRTSC